MGHRILEILPRLAACLVGQKKNGHSYHPNETSTCRFLRLFWGQMYLLRLTCSAGGTGVLLNIEKVASQLEQLGADVQVRGLVDSGWFLESKQQKTPECPDSLSCTPVDAIKKGLRYKSNALAQITYQSCLHSRTSVVFFRLEDGRYMFIPTECGTALFLRSVSRITSEARSGNAFSDTSCTLS